MELRRVPVAPSSPRNPRSPPLIKCHSCLSSFTCHFLRRSLHHAHLLCPQERLGKPQGWHRSRHTLRPPSGCGELPHQARRPRRSRRLLRIGEVRQRRLQPHDRSRRLEVRRFQERGAVNAVRASSPSTRRPSNKLPGVLQVHLVQNIG
jgi:hypothetical protein